MINPLYSNPEHAEYNRDACLAAADIARLRYRANGKYSDFKEWKDNIRQAWHMRHIVKNNRYNKCNHASIKLTGKFETEALDCPCGFSIPF